MTPSEPIREQVHRVPPEARPRGDVAGCVPTWAGGIGPIPAPKGPRDVATGGAARRRSRPTRNPWSRGSLFFSLLAPEGGEGGAGGTP